MADDTAIDRWHHGAAAARSFLQAQDTLLSHRVQWEPLERRVSADGSFGVTWGVTAAGLRGEPVRMGRYISAWRREGAAWRVAAHLQTRLNEAGEVTRLAGWTAPPLRPLSSSATLAPFIAADRGFAAQAPREGVAAAFADWAAPDAVLFGLTELIRGPDAIRQAFAGPPSEWQWEPVGAGGADDGSLGFTVGEATIRRADALVVVHGAGEKKRSLNTFYSGGYGGYGYRGWGGMGGMCTATTTETEYLVGTLVVDIFNAKTKQLMFRGTAQDEISDKPEKNVKKVEKASAKMFKNFPPGSEKKK